MMSSIEEVTIQSAGATASFRNGSTFACPELLAMECARLSPSGEFGTASARALPFRLRRRNNNDGIRGGMFTGNVAFGALIGQSPAQNHFESCRSQTAELTGIHHEIDVRGARSISALGRSRIAYRRGGLRSKTAPSCGNSLRRSAVMLA